MTASHGKAKGSISAALEMRETMPQPAQATEGITLTS